MLPQPQIYNPHHVKSPVAMHAKAVNRLLEEGRIITFDGIVWSMLPNLTWNQSFLMESILLLPDSRTLTHLK